MVAEWVEPVGDRPDATRGTAGARRPPVPPARADHRGVRAGGRRRAATVAKGLRISAGRTPVAAPRGWHQAARHLGATGFPSLAPPPYRKLGVKAEDNNRKEVSEMGISIRTAAIVSALLLAFLTVLTVLAGPASLAPASANADASATLSAVSGLADGTIDGPGDASTQGDGNTWG
jgi:hypothetical protein